MGAVILGPGVRGAVRPDVLRVGPLSVPKHLELRLFGPKFPGLTPRFSNTRISAIQNPDIPDVGPNLFRPGVLFHRISDIRGSYPTRSNIKFRLPPPVQISGVHTLQSEI